MDLASDFATEARMHARRAGYQAASGVRAIGSNFWGQLIGSKNPPTTPEELAQKNEAAAEADKQDYIQTRARVQAIYDEHRIKRQREEQERQQVIQQAEVKKIQEINARRAVQQDVATAIGKGSAETGRNYGAE